MTQAIQPDSTFTISAESLVQRKRNLLWGVGLSLLLVFLIGFGHLRRPETYNEVLLWSVVGFVLLANLVNYLRHRRYLRLIRDHRIEVYPGRVEFWSGGGKTVLNMSDIVALTRYRKAGALGHIQLRLTSGRGIRLEGYDDLDGLAGRLSEQISPAHRVERTP